MAEEQLSEKQEKAIELALMGMKDGEIARRVKVSRQWVNQWRNHNSLFIDALMAIFEVSALVLKKINSFQIIAQTQMVYNKSKNKRGKNGWKI